MAGSGREVALNAAALAWVGARQAPDNERCAWVGPGEVSSWGGLEALDGLPEPVRGRFDAMSGVSGPESACFKPTPNRHRARVGRALPQMRQTCSSDGRRGSNFPPEATSGGAARIAASNALISTSESGLATKVQRPGGFSSASVIQSFRGHCCVGRKQDNPSPQDRGNQVCESVRAAYLGRSESPISDSAPDRRAPRRLNATVPSCSCSTVW
jgi:hypothetical protein